MSRSASRPRKRLSRRQFGQALAAAAAAPLLATTEAAAPPTERPADLEAAADALAALVAARHGKHLSDEQRQRVRRSIRAGLSSVERLRRLPLTNADGPAFPYGTDLP
jgi:hypothetical protein